MRRGLGDQLWKATGVTQCGPLPYLRMRGWRHRKSGIPLSRVVQRIQPIIKFIFSPRLVGLVTRAMQQSETPETKQKPGISTSEIGKSGYL